MVDEKKQCPSCLLAVTARAPTQGQGWGNIERADKGIEAIFNEEQDSEPIMRGAMQKKRTTWVAILMLVVVGCLAAQATQAAEADEQAGRGAAGQFYGALQARFTGEVGPVTPGW